MPDMNLDASLRRAADKLAVTDLIHLRARGADRFDEALMRRCHVLDARENHGRFDGLAQEFIDGIVRSASAGSDCLGKSHVVANILAEPDGDAMFVESYHVVRETFRIDDAVEERRVGYRYLDRCVRNGAIWAFAGREAVYDWAWKSRRAADAHPGAAARGLLRGTRQRDDPSYQMLRHRTQPAPEQATRTAHDRELARLLDRQAIAETCYRVARAIDRNDPELARSWVLDEAALDCGSPPCEGGLSFHMVTNVMILDGSDERATVRSNFTRWTAPADGSGERTHNVSRGYHLDDFRRSAGAWKTARRQVVEDWQHVETGLGNYWTNHPARPFRTGTRDAGDPLYEYIARGT